MLNPNFEFEFTSVCLRQRTQPHHIHFFLRQRYEIGEVVEAR